MSNLSTFLNGLPIFSDLKPDELEELGSRFTLEKFKQDDLIIKQGEKSDKFYLVREGFVNIVRGVAEKGETEVFMTILGPGDHFGEAALFHEVKRTANVKAQDAVELLTIDRNQFSQYLQSHPIAASKILYQMLKLLFLRLDQTSAELQFERKGFLAQATIDKLLS